MFSLSTVYWKIPKSISYYVNFKAKETHDLRALLEICLEKDKDFLNLSIDEISELTEYAVEIRYPDELYYPKYWRGEKCL